ncbi:PREDICTED: endoplasmic reticulum-Golgi intermediate compartment protein 2-like [Lupinus angustifolius]|uniref:endoplasmic reticulum-Golgi intermediate compartment protein 2-like n=1 Tax=Lupinus angustifolius TaxID=3871 RepID=UPI00092F9DA2|nr:PREDICTED: endoplasmic reticulum-Golgi intermediate compartment protein 2-like [Lupinus angustifolius]
MGLGVKDTDVNPPRAVFDPKGKKNRDGPTIRANAKIFISRHWKVASGAIAHKSFSGIEPDGGKDHHEDSEQKNPLQSFDESTVNMIKKVKDALTNGAGCRVYGVLDVQRVAGNFHISVHGLNIYVAQMIFGGSNHVNVSHVIHDLSFGPIYPGLRNPLDETTRTLCDTSGTFKCYIKV